MSNKLSEIVDTLPFKGAFSVSEIKPVTTQSINLLEDGEKAELSECTNEKRKREFVSSRVCLKHLAKEIGCKEDIEIKKDDLGQPYGSDGGHSYYVSIAHSDHHIFCGITSTMPIGVDVEPIDRTVPDQLEQRITHPKEKKLLANIPAIRLWTIKEAYIKLRGQGLRMNMNEVQIGQESSQIFAELNNDKSPKICSFRLKNMWLAIAFYQK